MAGRVFSTSIICVCWLASLTNAQQTTPRPPAAANDLEKACVEFGRKIEQTMNAGDSSFFNQSLDVDALLEETTKGVAAPPAVKQGFSKGVKETFDLGTIIGKSISPKGGYKFLRYHQVDKRPRLLFRLLAGDQCNYHDLILSRDADGKFKVVDVFVFLTAEKMSETLRRSYLAAVAEQNRGILEKLVQSESDYLKNLPKIQEMIRLGQGGKSQEALQLFKQLPASVRKDKTVLILRLSYASQTGDEEFKRAVQEIKVALPNDPCLDLILVDSYFLEKDFPKALECLDRLDKAVGPDAHVNFLRANINYAAGDKKKAKEWGLKAIQTEPALAEPYWSLVTISLEDSEFKETGRLLSLLEKDAHMKIGDLKNVPAYAEFVKSPEYTAWMQSRNKK